VRRILLAAALLVLSGAAPARAMVTMQVNAVSHRGFVSMFVVTSPELTDVTINERVDGQLRLLVRPRMVIAPATPDYGTVNYGEAADFMRWKCSRRERVLVAVARSLTGQEETEDFTIRTPSCANRLTLEARPGEVTVTDTWGQGGLHPTLCVNRRCQVLEVAKPALTQAVDVARGDRVVLRTRYQRTQLTVGKRTRGGPPVLVTGDSMMQNLDTILEDRFRRRASVTSDVHPGAALSRDVGVNWLQLAHKQVAKVHPRATIVFLGANDAYDIGDARCCGPDWQAAYGRRAYDAMRTYAQGGAGNVVWVAIPIPRDERRRPAAVAVNAALRGAAAKVAGTKVLPADEVFTPNGEYRDTITYKGREVRVREADGLHLSLAGSRIAADYVGQLLEGFSVL
jgi:hypothetical protein